MEKKRLEKSVSWTQFKVVAGALLDRDSVGRKNPKKTSGRCLFMQFKCLCCRGMVM